MQLYQKRYLLYKFMNDGVKGFSGDDEDDEEAYFEQLPEPKTIRSPEQKKGDVNEDSEDVPIPKPSVFSLLSKGFEKIKKEDKLGTIIGKKSSPKPSVLTLLKKELEKEKSSTKKERSPLKKVKSISGIPSPDELIGMITSLDSDIYEKMVTERQPTIEPLYYIIKMYYNLQEKEYSIKQYIKDMSSVEECGDNKIYNPYIGRGLTKDIGKGSGDYKCKPISKEIGQLIKDNWESEEKLSYAFENAGKDIMKHRTFKEYKKRIKLFKDNAETLLEEKKLVYNPYTGNLTKYSEIKSNLEDSKNYKGQLKEDFIYLNRYKRNIEKAQKSKSGESYLKNDQKGCKQNPTRKGEKCYSSCCINGTCVSKKECESGKHTKQSKISRKKKK
jgi:hypothetical protein